MTTEKPPSLLTRLLACYPATEGGYSVAIGDSRAIIVPDIVDMIDRFL